MVENSEIFDVIAFLTQIAVFPEQPTTDIPIKLQSTYFCGRDS
jgi:hypothetical protein